MLPKKTTQKQILKSISPSSAIFSSKEGVSANPSGNSQHVPQFVLFKGTVKKEQDDCGTYSRAFFGHKQW